MSETTNQAPPPWAATNLAPIAPPATGETPAIAPPAAPASPSAAEVKAAEKEEARLKAEAEAQAKLEADAAAKLEAQHNAPLAAAANAAKADAQPTDEPVVTVTVTVPKAFNLRVDDHTVVPYKAGVQEMPLEHAQHWWAVKNGVVEYAPKKG